MILIRLLALTSEKWDKLISSQLRSSNLMKEYICEYCGIRNNQHFYLTSP